MTEVGLKDAAGRIAVLPFESLTEDPGDAYFARGFVEDLIVELTRFPSLEVLHPDSSLGGAVEPAALDGAGVTLVLRGTVRRGEGTLRVTARLVEAGSDRQLWAARFDAPATEVLEVQDEVVASVASALAIEADSARLSRARREPLQSLEAYDCWLRGAAALHRGTREDDDRARTCFERALTLDPGFARAHAGLALSHFNEWSCQMWELWDEKERLAFEHASRAAALDDTDAHVQMVLARVQLYRRAFAEAARLVERALALNPNDADVLAHAALARAYLGDAASGVALARKAMRLHPRHPDWYVACLVVPLFAAERFAEARDAALRAPRALVDVPAYLAASAALAGDRAGAERHLAAFRDDFRSKVLFCRDAEPGEELRWIALVNPFREAAPLTALARGLELAGRRDEPAGADAVLDERARREVRARIRELEEQIEEAERDADLGRAERAREELDRLVTTLAGALGLGGRPRRVGSAVERARSSVTWRIRSAIRKIGAAHAPLGRHLENAVRTGTTCVYQPETPVDWAL